MLSVQVKPDQEVKFKPGRVWFTLEVQVDDESSLTRYSILKSAATIGLLSLAVGAVAATAGAALLPASATAGAVADGLGRRCGDCRKLYQ
jgi:ferredoxin-NADP reductase